MTTRIKEADTYQEVRDRIYRLKLENPPAQHEWAAAARDARDRELIELGSDRNRILKDVNDGLDLATDMARKTYSNAQNYYNLNKMKFELSALKKDPQTLLYKESADKLYLMNEQAKRIYEQQLEDYIKNMRRGEKQNRDNFRPEDKAHLYQSTPVSMPENKRPDKMEEFLLKEYQKLNTGTKPVDFDKRIEKFNNYWSGYRNLRKSMLDAGATSNAIYENNLMQWNRQREDELRMQTQVPSLSGNARIYPNSRGAVNTGLDPF